MSRATAPGEDATSSAIHAVAPPTSQSRMVTFVVHASRSNSFMTAVAIGGIILVWEIVVLLRITPSYVLPSPAAVAISMVQRWPALGANLAVTVIEVFEGFGIAVGVGIPIAVAIAFSSVVERLVYPVLVATQAVPKVAVAPIFLVWFGLGTVPRVVLAALLAVFPVILDAVLGLRAVDTGLLALSRAANAGFLRTFRLIRLPMAIPSVLFGFKMGVTFAIIGAVIGEFVGGDTGLGYVVTVSQGQLDMPLAFATVVLLAALGMVLFFGVELLEQALFARRGWGPGHTT